MPPDLRSRGHKNAVFENNDMHPQGNNITKGYEIHF